MIQPDASDSFEHLITRLNAGDQLAFDEFFLRYDPKVRSFIRNWRRLYHQKLRSLYDTGDFSNDVWSTLWLRIPSMHVANETDFLGYMSQIARDKIIDACRKQYTRKRDVSREMPMYQVDENGPAFEPTSHEPTPSQYAVAEEARETLTNESTILGEDSALIFRMKSENYTNQEIATATGIHPRRVQRILQSIKMRFMKKK